MSLVEQRCLNHAQREAVARCPSCQHYYCRECVTEHADRILCAACLKKNPDEPSTEKSRLDGLLRMGQFGAAVFLLWFLSLGLGRALLAMPDSFHKGTYWHNNVWEDE